MISPIMSLFQVMLLVEAGADAGAIDEDGNNSLHIATRYTGSFDWNVSGKIHCQMFKLMRRATTQCTLPQGAIACCIWFI